MRSDGREIVDMEMGDLMCDWRVPPAKLDLPQNTIHLWCTTLKQASVYKDELRGTLTPDERAKAARILFSKDRDGFVAVRGALRDILGRYTNRAPTDLKFFYGAYGKPHLAPSPGSVPLHFNSSRSDELGIFAVTQTHEVGIDVEVIKPCEDYEAIASSFFSPSEIQALCAFPPVRRLHTFLKYWTRKEALSKALGTGFMLDWTTFDVSPVPPERVQVMSNGPSKWSVYSFFPAPGYLGALAFAGTNPTLKFWTWPGMAFSNLPIRIGEIGSSIIANSMHPVLSKQVTG